MSQTKIEQDNATGAGPPEWTRHAAGVLSKVRKRDGERIYFCQVGWQGKRYTEKAGTTERQATKLLGTRQAEVDNGTYIPPRERKKRRRKAATDREALRFDRAADSFVAKCGAEYSRLRDITSMTKFLKMYFGTRYLDELIPADVDAYFDARMKHAAPFPKGGRKTGLRSPQREIILLSQVVGFMQDAGAEIDNPCRREAGRGRRKKTKSRIYIPQREGVVPSNEVLGAILAGNPARFTEAHRTFFTVAYFTGGRPESEVACLTHGRVELCEDNVTGIDGKPVLGWVRFRDAKTKAGNRDIPLHPEAAKALRSLMLPIPQGEAERKVWAETPIFRTETKKGVQRRWNKDSYRKAWANLVELVPAATGMIVRDLRKVFSTRLRDAGVSEVRIDRLMGHAKGLAGRYDVAEDAMLRAAILTLPVPMAPALGTEAAQVASQVASDPSNGPQASLASGKKA